MNLQVRVLVVRILVGSCAWWNIAIPIFEVAVLVIILLCVIDLDQAFPQVALRVVLIRVVRLGAVACVPVVWNVSVKLVPRT